MSNHNPILVPTITKPNEKNNILTFTLANVNYSIANALRRTILSDIDTVVLKTGHPKDGLIKIFNNTTRFHNEIIKQRLHCIPVHIKDTKQSFDNLVVEINETNDTNAVRYITTEHFKIKDVNTGKYLNDDFTKKVFPPNKISKDFILFVRLRPRISDTIPGEKIHLEIKLTVSNAIDDGGFNVVSTCAYGNTPDKVRQLEVWDDKEKSMEDNKYKSTEIASYKKNWMIHDSKRIFLDDSFDFKIETVGVFSNTEIVILGCDILIDKINLFINLFNQDRIKIQPDSTVMDNSYDITLENEDYTLGKVIEYLLHELWYKKHDDLTYVGFIKEHPHDNHSIIRIAFKDKDKSNTDNISSIFKNVLEHSKTIYENIKEHFQIKK